MELKADWVSGTRLFGLPLIRIPIDAGTKRITVTALIHGYRGNKGRNTLTANWGRLWTF